jgi:hypothetical protein
MFDGIKIGELVVANKQSNVYKEECVYSFKTPVSKTTATRQSSLTINIVVDFRSNLACANFHHSYFFCSRSFSLSLDNRSWTKMASILI